MRRLALAALLVAATAAAAAPPACPAAEGGTLQGLRFTGRGDAACRDPVRIEGARNTGTGQAGIRHWLAACRPGQQPAERALRRDQGRTYEVVELRRAGAEPERICFDITAYFGTW